MNYKEAAKKLAAELRTVAKGTAAFVAVGTFFGGAWNLVAAVVIYAVIVGAAFCLDAWAYDQSP